jgi:hypothetical protein
MKRLLIYNQRIDPQSDHPSINQPDLEVEQVGRVSEVLRRLLLSAGHEHIKYVYDMFLVNAEETTTDLVEFLRYVRKYKPDLPLLVFTKLPEKKSLLNQLLKDSGCQIFESVNMQDAFSGEKEAVLHRRQHF